MKDGAGDATSDAEAQSKNSLLWIIASSAAFMAMATFCFGLFYFSRVLLPLTVAALLSYVVEPPVNALSRVLEKACACKRNTAKQGIGAAGSGRSYGTSDAVPAAEESSTRSWCCYASLRLVSVVVVLLLILGVVICVALLLINQSEIFVKDWPAMKSRALSLTAAATSVLSSHHIDVADVERHLLEWIKAKSEYIVTESVAIGINVTSALVLTFLCLLFILITRQADTKPPAMGVKSVWAEIDEQVRRYMVLQTFISVLTAIACGVIYISLRVKLAFLFVLVTFLSNFVPNVGALVATWLPLPILLIDPEMSYVRGFAAIAIPTALHFGIGSILSPLVFSWDKRIELHPVIVLLTLGFWGMIWGVPGMVLSVPLAVVTRILLNHAERICGSPRIFGPMASIFNVDHSD